MMLLISSGPPAAAATEAIDFCSWSSVASSGHAICRLTLNAEAELSFGRRGEGGCHQTDYVKKRVGIVTRSQGALGAVISSGYISFPHAWMSHIRAGL